MRAVKRADLCATADALQRKADGLVSGDQWLRRNPFGKDRHGRNHSIQLAGGGSYHRRTLTAPRNAVCPCGSGAKFKKCCGGGK